MFFLNLNLIKIDIEDVNKALIGIHKELDVKSNQAELNNIVSDQAIINESLCTENIVGRWTWKSGSFTISNLYYKNFIHNYKFRFIYFF